MRFKQRFAALIYRRSRYNYLFIGMGVLRTFRPYGGAGCAGVCGREVFWRGWLLLWFCFVILGN